MDKATAAKLVSFGGFILATTAIAWTVNGSYVVDRPVQSCSLGFLLVGGALVGLHAVLRQLFNVEDKNHDEADIPLRKDTSPEPSNESDILTPRGQRIAFCSAVVAICARVEIFRQTLGYRQCTVPGIEGFLPLLLAVREYTSQRTKRHQDRDLQHNEPRNTAVSQAINGFLRQTGPAALIAIANYLASHVSASPRSTYICPVAFGGRQWTLLLQVIGLILDCTILICVKDLLRRRRNVTWSNAGKAPVIIGALMIFSSLLISLFGVIACIIRPEYRARIRNIEGAYFGSLVWMAILFTFVMIFAIRLLASGDLLDFVMIVSFTSTYIIGFSSSWTSRVSFPGSLQLTAATSLTLLFTGIVLYLSFNTTLEVSGAHSSLRFFARISRSIYPILFLMFLLRVFVDVTPNNEFDAHPIDVLLSEAAKQHQAWREQSATSSTLLQAVAEYRRRYKRHPPPHFDKWYEYASSRHSLVIDDFDTMYDDLLPFWAFEPQYLRARTRELLSDTWNEVAEVTVRSGKAEIGEKMAPTHRWMVEGAIAMMSSFIEHLPDMDLALNINDESRVAIPHADLKKYRDVGMNTGQSTEKKDNTWSVNRAQSWEASNDPTRTFEDHSFTNTFYNYGSISCPPESPARQRHIWDPRTLCTSCFSPHSIGPFIRNWTLSASPCHQPDLINLHGFYLSPAAFKSAHEPLPVFSQSKAHGYADLLYPSPWNYMDKVRYDPSPSEDVGDTAHPDLPFAEKRNTLFWRGATSEGLSVVGTWKGMTRQRLVHLANNHTSRIPVLLPDFDKQSKQKYQFMSSKAISSHPYLQNTTMNISVVDKIVRCGDTDCPIQEAEFGLASPIEFQEHWQYRYLMDVDGAGFSGRFLPFLQSRSLVFKAALFREWYDARLTAWQHFVPIDLRLHGLWSTLAYFGGGGKDGDGTAGRVKEGETIANQGKEWAGKVLRKEDMEIYFFRLLLEWGRLTDDRRDEIGFELP